ncbi:MAG: DUF4405 domain-containing protein [Candidatus Electryonea clarkiae]|nr:DUF4405 domain-containing protein [Candidatus Electryonea clarkiae]MDP8286550.1 DUF4405 domain-containing protein [Candidatus Electryonea clarkiae]
MKHTKFKFKILTSFILTISFLLASFSGIILFLTPKGRIANWINWTSLGLDKDQWSEIHIVFVATMLISGLLHLFWFNWKVFWSYIKNKSSRSIRRPWELGISCGLGIILWIGTIYNIQPVNSLSILSDIVKESYEESQNEPPVPHAEEMTLLEAAEKLAGIPVEELIDKLKSAGYQSSGEDQELGELAKKYNIAPQKLLEIISEENELQEKISSSLYHIAGQGKMSVEEYCKLKEIDLDTAIKRLKSAGFVDISLQKTLKEYAAESKLPPSDIAKILLEGKN